MSCSTYILYIYIYTIHTIIYIYYTIHTIYYILYYTILYILHTIIYDIYIYTTSPLRFLTSASGKRSISGSGGSSSSESLSSRARLSAGLGTAKAPRKSWGNRGESWESWETPWKVPPKFENVWKPISFCSPTILRWWFSHWFMETPGLWKWPGQNGHFFFTTSISTAAKWQRQTKQRARKKDEALRSSRRYLPGDERWQPSPADIHGFPSTAQPQNQEKWSW